VGDNWYWVSNWDPPNGKLLVPTAVESSVNAKTQLDS